MQPNLYETPIEIVQTKKKKKVSKSKQPEINKNMQLNSRTKMAKKKTQQLSQTTGGEVRKGEKKNSPIPAKHLLGAVSSDFLKPAVHVYDGMVRLKRIGDDKPATHAHGEGPRQLDASAHQKTFLLLVFLQFLAGAHWEISASLHL